MKLSSIKHGGDLSDAIAHYGGAAQDWLDLSSGINPHPWPVDTSLWVDALHRLPARTDEEALIDSGRQAYNVPRDAALITAPGTQALIQWLPHLAPIGSVGILAPTYGEHALSWQRAGRTVAEFGDIKEIPADIRHVIIVNPNNPDGRVIEAAPMRAIAEEMKRRGGWLIIDESFADIDPATDCAKLCAEFPVLVLRSFGKFFGLPGLRLGFLIAPAPIAALFQDALGPWCVSAPALIIGAAALRDGAWIAATRTALPIAAQKLDAVLVTAGFRIIGGLPLFRLVDHEDAPALHEKLARQRIWCRAFDDNPTWLRFGLPPDDAGLARLKAALGLGAPGPSCEEPA